MRSISTLEILPDELLLEVCKYLLPIDVLQCFFGLNGRITRLIKYYRNNVSLYKGSFGQSNYIYTSIFPKIGSEIRTLVIDRLYSVLQVNMFNHYYNNKKLSNIFPCLEKLTLIAFRQETLIPFINKFEGFEHLTEVNIRDLFSIPLEHQPTALETLLKANNEKIRSLSISHCWCCLRLNKLSNIVYSNIIHLEIIMEKFEDLVILFTAIPNINKLNVTLMDNISHIPLKIESLSLIHLINFRLISVRRFWRIEELISVLHGMPNLQYVLLQLSTFDSRLVDGKEIITLKQSLSQVQQFNYGVYYITAKDNFDRHRIISSWPPSSIEFLVDETTNVDRIFAFIQTLSSHDESFPLLVLPVGIINKAMPIKKDDRQVDKVYINDVSTFSACLPLMTRWRRVEELTIWFSNINTTTTVVKNEQQQQQTSILPKLVRLKHLSFGGLVPSDLHHFSHILLVASNLIRLDLSFDFLLVLIDNEDINHLFQQRIRALSINKVSTSTVSGITEEHISRIGSSFPRVRYMFVDLSHSLPFMDSMVMNILIEFNKRLVSFCADGQPSEEMKIDARKWLEDNNNKTNMSIVHPTEFDAYFNVIPNRLLIWM